jgi:hypothetical protein
MKSEVLLVVVHLCHLLLLLLLLLVLLQGKPDGLLHLRGSSPIIIIIFPNLEYL